VRHRLDAALLTALREHGGWLEIQGVGAFVDEDPTPAERLVRELAAGLCDLEVQALHVWGARDAHARLALADASTAARLRSPERLDTVFADAPPLYLERRAAGGESSGDTTDPNRRRELRAFARSVAAHGREQPHLVRVRLQLGAASEDLWLRVVSAEPTDYGQHKFTGELRGDSQLWPHLKKGEWLVIEAHEVQEWTRETP
jgi:hypothetical protein